MDAAEKGRVKKMLTDVGTSGRKWTLMVVGLGVFILGGLGRI